MKPLRIALVHDWLTGMRGGELVLEAMAEIFPRAELFTLIYIPGTVSPVLTTLRRHVSPLQKIPSIEKRYRWFLPAMPWAIGRFDLSEFDLVLSSSHCVAKGVLKAPDAVHVSYVHAPMRYMWERFDDYFGPGRALPPVRWAARLARGRLQAWDREVSSRDRIDALIANSYYIAGRIKEYYERDSRVVFPFANPSRFSSPRKPGRNYLIVGALAPYKRIDIAVEAFNRLKLPLLVVGGGQCERRLKRLAGPTVDFLGPLSNSAVEDLLAKCRAFVFPGLEDFGIAPVEAMAAGSPVIAYRAGGAMDTINEKTGVFFDEQTPESLMEAVLKVEKGEVRFDEADCRAQAGRFTRERFQREFLIVVRDAWKAAGKDPDVLEEQVRSGWMGRA